MCRGCEERLGGWLLRRAPECQVNLPRLRRTPRGVAALASPREPGLFAAIAEDASGGGCFGEPPSAKLICRDCGGRLGGWLLWRAPECQVSFAAVAEDASGAGCFGEPPSARLVLPRLRRTPRGVAALMSPRVPRGVLRNRGKTNLAPIGRA